MTKVHSTEQFLNLAIESGMIVFFMSQCEPSEYPIRDASASWLP